MSWLVLFCTYFLLHRSFQKLGEERKPLWDICAWLDTYGVTLQVDPYRALWGDHRMLHEAGIFLQQQLQYTLFAGYPLDQSLLPLQSMVRRTKRVLQEKHQLLPLFWGHQVLIFGLCLLARHVLCAYDFLYRPSFREDLLFLGGGWMVAVGLNGWVVQRMPRIWSWQGHVWSEMAQNWIRGILAPGQGNGAWQRAGISSERYEQQSLCDEMERYFMEYEMAHKRFATLYIFCELGLYFLGVGVVLGFPMVRTVWS